MNMIKTFLGLDFYTSELDDFLMDFDRKHPKLSRSQEKEVKKYQRIYALRDNTQKTVTEKSFWPGF